MRTRKQELDVQKDVATRTEAAFNWWTTGDMAKRAGVSARQVRAWIKAKQLPALNVAPGKKRGEYRIRENDGERFIREVLAA